MPMKETSTPITTAEPVSEERVKKGKPHRSTLEFLRQFARVYQSQVKGMPGIVMNWVAERHNRRTSIDRAQEKTYPEILDTDMIHAGGDVGGMKQQKSVPLSTRAMALFFCICWARMMAGGRRLFV